MGLVGPEHMTDAELEAVIAILGLALARLRGPILRDIRPYSAALEADRSVLSADVART